METAIAGECPPIMPVLPPAMAPHAALRRANPDAAVLVRAFDLGQRVLFGFVSIAASLVHQRIKRSERDSCGSAVRCWPLEAS
jgi:hypothetical protein